MGDGTTTAGFLHPGQMGVTIAAAVSSAGYDAAWVSAGRSGDTKSRATTAGLHDHGTVDQLCSRCDYIFSVCPPDQAGAVANQVVAAGFTGTYIDCNAVSPVTAHQVADVVAAAGANFVDGGIIGPPAHSKGTTRLYLSGSRASQVASLFEGSLVDARMLGDDAGAASALKMAYAGWTKGSAALLMNQFALAKANNVDQALLQEWSISIPGMAEKLSSQSVANAPKAWRFVGEMNEIADTLRHAGLSAAWFEGAAETYARLAQFKDRPDVDTDTIISALVKNGKE